MNDLNSMGRLTLQKLSKTLNSHLQLLVHAKKKIILQSCLFLSRYGLAAYRPRSNQHIHYTYTARPCSVPFLLLLRLALHLVHLHFSVVFLH